MNMDEMYKVYAKLDSNNCIVSIESSAFYDVSELEGYIQIDEGVDGYIYGHAQPNYLNEKYGKPTYDESGHANFKYVSGNVIELTDEEKSLFFPPVEPEPSDIDIALADIYFQLASLQSEGMPVSTFSLNSPRYAMIKRFYDMGLYSDIQLDTFVKCGWITEEEKNTITKVLF